jgi:aldoxime dehydratase
VESAIPKYLQRPRTRQRRMPLNHVPPYPSAVGRFKPSIKRVVMAYFGVQQRHPEHPAASKLLHTIASAFGYERGPGHWDRAQYVDEAGFTNTLSIGYWDAPGDFETWFAKHGRGWAKGPLASDDVGTFTEVLRPAVERFETLFSSNTPEGVACLADGMSNDVQEHAYWGGARDRIPLSQTSDLEPMGEPRVLADGPHQRVLPHENICLIRSGQDWTATEADERRMYIEEVEPVLRAGMTFLRDDGLQVGCFANRYMAVVDTDGQPLDKTFGMSWWRSLAALEHWAESHPTHVAIFGAALRYLGALGPAAKLKLYHEVTVAAKDEQYFEYFNCHHATGMLRTSMGNGTRERIG